MSKYAGVLYAVKCMATKDVLCESAHGLRYGIAALLAEMETIARLDAISETGFATPEECAAAVAACEYVVTPLVTL